MKLTVPRSKLRSLFEQAGLGLPPHNEVREGDVVLESIDRSDLMTLRYHLFGVLSYAPHGYIHHRTFDVLEKYFDSEMTREDVVKYLRDNYTTAPTT